MWRLLWNFGKNKATFFQYQVVLFQTHNLLFDCRRSVWNPICERRISGAYIFLFLYEKLPKEQ